MGLAAEGPCPRHCEEARRSNLYTNRKIASFLAMTGKVPRNEVSLAMT